MADNDQKTEYAKVVARAWRDEAFKARLLSDPAAALSDAGIDLPAGLTLKVVENTDSLFHLVLPPQPDGELDDEALEKIAAGYSAEVDLRNHLQQGAITA